ISATADSLAPEIETFLSAEPRVIFQSDWSRGGDAIIADRSIRKPEDLKGKRIAFLPASPSHTLLLHVLDTAKLNYRDLQLVETTSARDAATLFKNGKVDAAVVWSPDDEDCESGARRCVKSVAGSRIYTIHCDRTDRKSVARKLAQNAREKELRGRIPDSPSGHGKTSCTF
ncbi:MAG TPA: ABC transporter substrate-binding protein, partial [Leptospiraceae bacterium]|nr:ABC transporter substrate-binding protein [Leptospiraceae bacterium]